MIIIHITLKKYFTFLIYETVFHLMTNIFPLYFPITSRFNAVKNTPLHKKRW